MRTALPHSTPAEYEKDEKRNGRQYLRVRVDVENKSIMEHDPISRDAAGGTTNKKHT